mmetsp:Transcript_5380/g.18627  ORF Transcript_5380/g.18627 Transcript_5380/m.18627 type:complete len:237 (-) Transcript_5380:1117-1827(-)
MPSQPTTMSCDAVLPSAKRHSTPVAPASNSIRSFPSSSVPSDCASTSNACKSSRMTVTASERSSSTRSLAAKRRMAPARSALKSCFGESPTTLRPTTASSGFPIASTSSPRPSFASTAAPPLRLKPAPVLGRAASPRSYTRTLAPGASARRASASVSPAGPAPTMPTDGPGAGSAAEDARGAPACLLRPRRSSAWMGLASVRVAADEGGILTLWSYVHVSSGRVQGVRFWRFGGAL